MLLLDSVGGDAVACSRYQALVVLVVSLLDVAISYALTSRFATPVGVEERKVLRGLKFSQCSKYKRLRDERKIHSRGQ